MAYKDPEAKKAWYQANKEKQKARMKVYYEANKAKFLERAKKRSEEKGEEIKAYQAEYREKNAEKLKEYFDLRYDINRDKMIAKTREWQKEYPEKHARKIKNYLASTHGRQTRNAARNSRRKRFKEASLANLWRKEILAIYKRAQAITLETGIKHEVDHYIPLLGKSVCGLHVPWNLFVMPALANRKKTNSFDVDMFT